jgi:hypothetical protein
MEPDAIMGAGTGLVVDSDGPKHFRKIITKDFKAEESE